MSQFFAQRAANQHSDEKRLGDLADAPEIPFLNLAVALTVGTAGFVQSIKRRVCGLNRGSPVRWNRDGHIPTTNSARLTATSTT